jgi:trehalose 6-phosphate phosphatase
LNDMTRPALPITPELAARLEGRPLVLLLDIDGTLAPIAPRPEQATVPAPTRAVLSVLAALRDVHVVFVTGRSATDGRRLVSVDEGWVIGNHGMEIAPPGAVPEARAAVAGYAPKIRDAVGRMNTIVDERAWAGVLVEDKQYTLSVHYRLADAGVVPVLIDEVEKVAEALELRLTRGKEVLELRPPIAVDKGTAAVELADLLGAAHDGASLFSAGDDRTDEDMFRVLRSHQPRAVTVHVGSALLATEAEFTVADPDTMRELLRQILALRTSKAAIR